MWDGPAYEEGPLPNPPHPNWRSRGYKIDERRTALLGPKGRFSGQRRFNCASTGSAARAAATAQVAMGLVKRSPPSQSVPSTPADGRRETDHQWGQARP
jgi:hypothetical protein